MGYAQDLLDEIDFHERYGPNAIMAEEIVVDMNPKLMEFAKAKKEVEMEVEAELHNAIQQELAGKLRSDSAQKLIDQVSKIIFL